MREREKGEREGEKEKGEREGERASRYLRVVRLQANVVRVEVGRRATEKNEREGERRSEKERGEKGR